ncbi:MAG: sulfotransferase family 2 domain-containing protein [Saprospiraceae bacterium]
MAHFKSTIRKAYISTSFKVMWSSLKAQENLKKLKGFPLFFRKIGEAFKIIPKHEHYLLVRNPYKRLESCFKDKFRKNLPVKRGQTIHRLFYPILGITKNDELQKVHEILLAYTFEDFIKELPSVYNKDPHLYPQFWSSLLGFNRLNWNAKFNKIYKLEHQQDIQDLEQNFKLNLKKTKNSTKKVETNIVWTSEMREIVNKIYKNDFLWYNYSPIN